MHRLGRWVRFSISPFLAGDEDGFNPYASRPTGEGVSVYFELGVELAGKVEPATGFVVNVSDIDKAVRKYVVPIFTRVLSDEFGHGRHIGFAGIAELLRQSWKQLAGKFGGAGISRLSLRLNPFREMTIKKEDGKMVYFGEKFEFAATHKLWNDSFSEEKNFEVFGKCANPTGHGHNYISEVVVEVPAENSGFNASDFEKVVDEKFINLVDHKNLNVDIAEFGRVNPTVENITAFAWKKLAGKFGEAKLHCITVWETDKTYCSYSESAGSV